METLNSPLLLAVWLLFLWASLYLSVILHEAGHAIAGTWAGFRVTSWGMGLGKPLLVCRIGSSLFYLGATNPFQGLTWAVHPTAFPSRRASTILLLGGPCANFLLCIVVFGAVQTAGNLAVFVQTFAWANALIFVITLMPVQVDLGKIRVASDGARLLRILCRVGIHLPLQSPALLLAMRPLWKAIGDDVTLYTHLLSAAASCLDVEDTEKARSFLAEAEALWSVQPEDSLFATYVLQLQARLINDEGNASEAMCLFEHVASVSEDQGQTAMAYLARLSLARVTHTSPTIEETLEQEFPSLATFRSSVEVAYADDRVLMETALAHYQAARSSVSYCTADMFVMKNLITFRERHEEWGEAAIAYEAALTTARQLYGELGHDPAVQDAWGERCQPLCDAATRCLRDLGRVTEAEEFATFLPSKIQARRLRREAKRKHRKQFIVHRRAENTRWKRGAILTLLNVALIGLVSIALHLNFLPHPIDRALLGGAVGMSLPTVPAVVTLSVSAIARRRADMDNSPPPTNTTDAAFYLIVLAFFAWGAGFALASLLGTIDGPTPQN